MVPHSPDVADDGPRGHHEEEVGEHPVLRRVPEGVAELGVVLDRHGVDRPSNLKVKSVSDEVITQPMLDSGLTSKQPFLNCMTDVLLMQVPSGKIRIGSLFGSST